MNIPVSAEDLIDDLAQRYPEVIYDPAENREEFLIRTGERRLVLTLLALRQQDVDDSRGGAS